MSQPVPHSKPIPIATDHLRNRAASFSSDSSTSPTSPPPVTPPKHLPTHIPVAPSSPILYFLSQSPSKQPPAFSFRGFPPPPLLQDDPAEDTKPPPHARRASTAGRFQPPPPAPEPHHERGVNVLRRLSLSQRPKPSTDTPPRGNPSPPPTSAFSTAHSNNNNNNTHHRKFRRSATVTEHSRPRRAPSPMGERILKGHFDGFN